jgi:hypothetical protein
MSPIGGVRRNSRIILDQIIVTAYMKRAGKVLIQILRIRMPGKLELFKSLVSKFLSTVCRCKSNGGLVFQNYDINSCNLNPHFNANFPICLRTVGVIKNAHSYTNLIPWKTPSLEKCFFIALLK